MTAQSRLHDRCQHGARRSIGDRLADALGVLSLRARCARRYEVRPAWLDDDGLQPAGVPRRPAGPRPEGSVTLALPEPEKGEAR